MCRMMSNGKHGSRLFRGARMIFPVATVLAGSETCPVSRPDSWSWHLCSRYPEHFQTTAFRMNRNSATISKYSRQTRVAILCPSDFRLNRNCFSVFRLNRWRNDTPQTILLFSMIPTKSLLVKTHIVEYKRVHKDSRVQKKESQLQQRKWRSQALSNCCCFLLLGPIPKDLLGRTR